MKSIDSPLNNRYDRRTIVLHWMTAVLVAMLWLSAQVIDWFPNGPARVNMRSVHVLLGVVLSAVLARRIVWRSLAGTRRSGRGASRSWLRVADFRVWQCRRRTRQTSAQTHSVVR